MQEHRRAMSALQDSLEEPADYVQNQAHASAQPPRRSNDAPLPRPSNSVATQPRQSNSVAPGDNGTPTPAWAKGSAGNV